MRKEEWFQPAEKNPFGISYLEEFALPLDRTMREVHILQNIIASLPKKPRVLDIAGGFGRIGSALLETNTIKLLVNLDLNYDFLCLARKNKLIHVSQGDMRHISFAEKSFDLAMLMFTAFGYFNDEENIRVLHETYRILDENGTFIMDMPNYERISQNFSHTRQKKLQNGDTIFYQKHIEGIFLIEERTKKQSNGKEEFLTSLRLRIYSSQELLNLCKKVGFNEVFLYDQDLKQFTPNTSQRLWIVCKK